MNNSNNNSRLQKTFYNINSRCASQKDKKYIYYGGRGIRNLLTMKELRFVWERDGAVKMKQPSIDRIDSDGNYEINNIRFIEMADNRKKRGFIKCSNCDAMHRGWRKRGVCRRCRLQIARIQRQESSDAIPQVIYHLIKLGREFDMTPPQIANEIRVTRQSIYNWLAGRSEPQSVFRDALKNLYDRKAISG